MRRSRAVLAAVLIAAAALPALAAPQRVVSMNLCIDQLAMMLAAPGQLVSVSGLARDPRLSPMAEQAAALTPNTGRAEEIYLLRPDLVIAGTYTPQATLAMLRRLGLRVEILPPAEDFDAIRAQITRMGALLERQVAARDLLARFDADLAAARVPSGRGRAALYYANGFTSGGDTLAGSILKAAGYDNIAADYGISATTHLPMEVLVMARPDRLITGATWPGQSQGEAILDHPALAGIAPTSRQVTDRNWICGTPFVTRAIRSLR
ncbi:ABC transporter substrate-binding protein [Paracoccus sp. WLY502]|uniref:ABC transporter substrate-binding protein n=1 Tax=Paracoccus yibinensis TaxID=3068891 RepID=UPI002796516E|nr:ABC transporter substrate-binding protein [Paracoccus sp. WLY502]MDQ1900082.1 ABC transporter substrate-binding protein [Paracoccus sp. WLY502]